MENTDETIPIDVDDRDDEDPIEEEQLNEYREMVENLGTFPVSRLSREVFGYSIPTHSISPSGQSQDQQSLHGS
jgi:hypothetical protein